MRNSIRKKDSLSLSFDSCSCCAKATILTYRYCYKFFVDVFIDVKCNHPFQNFLRMQTTENSSSESYDLITETAQFLEALEREIDPTNIDTAIQVFVTMAEYSQGKNNTQSWLTQCTTLTTPTSSGPCSENQLTLIRTKLCENVNWILANKYSLCRPADARELHEQCCITLLSLLEGITNPYIPRQMLVTLDFKIMVPFID